MNYNTSEGWINQDMPHEAIIANELGRLLEDERRLKSIYHRLESRSDLRRQFMSELAAINVRAERLEALMNRQYSNVSQ